MWDTVKNFFYNLSPTRIIVGYYLLTVTFATILLSLPIARQQDVPWSFIDSLFTAVSAVSVTGLTTVSIADTFTPTGIIFLIIILQIGGIGIMALGTFFWLLFRKKIGLKGRQLIMTDQNQIKFAGVVNLMKHILIIFFLIEVIGAFILGLYYLRYFSSWQDALFHGLFSSVSATTNAGFDITGSSVKPYAGDYFVQFIHMLLIILGAIGFPVLIEVKNYLQKRRTVYHFSLTAKITTVTYFLLAIFGAMVFFIFEFSKFLSEKNWHESLFYSLFQSVSTRSAGLVTLDLQELSTATLLLFAILMFIGASPSSVGGGIRTTTFALNILFFFQFAKGNRIIKVFKREIHEEDLLKSFVVTTFAVLLVVTSVILLSFTEDVSLIAIIFEVCSAFGTCGMSLGITDDLTIFGKILIMILMFIGRVGIVSFMFMLGGKEKKENFHYPKERVTIG